MNNQFTRFFTVIAVALLFSISLQAQHNTRTLPKPYHYDCDDGRIYQNQILYGATPNNSASKPVLVYVHGYMDNGYGWFFQENKMYHKSYVNGYRTAFLGHPRTEGIHENGATISSMIQQIVAHYNTNDIVIVAHSKGGLDTEMAMIEYGADQYVKAVITLSTPFQGVPAADLYGFPILTPIINSFPIFGNLLKQEGTVNLQTGYIQGVIRPYLDNHPNNSPEKFITIGGKGKTHRPNFPLWVPQDLPNILFHNAPSCLELPVGNINEILIKSFFTASGLLTDGLPTSIHTHGGNNQNDGLVPYYSSIRPGSHEYLTVNNNQANLDHGEFLYAGAVWKFIQPILNNLDNIIASNSRQENPITSDYSETLTSSMQLVSPILGQTFSVNNSNAKFSLISNDEAINVNQNGNKINPDYKEDEDKLVALKRINEIQPNIEYSIQSNKDYIGILQDVDLKIEAQFNFDAPKTFLINQSIKEKIKVTIPSFLQEEIYLELSISSDLNGQPKQSEQIRIPFVETQRNVFVPVSLPNNLTEGIYSASIVAKGNNRNSILFTSLVLKNDLSSTFEQKEFVPVVFPNPANEILYFSNIVLDDFAGVKIYDVKGTLVLDMQLTNEAIDINRLNAGIYIVEIQQGSKFSTQKFIKN